MKTRMIAFSLIFVAIHTGVCQGGIRIGILGDRTGGADATVFQGVVNELSLLKPDIVVNVGDLIEGPQPDADAINREWDRVFKELQPLECPLYHVPGNNDIFDDTSRRLYTERTGRQPDYSFVAGDIRFIVLDNSCMKSWDELSEQRFAWLRTELGKSRKDDRICVIFHKPFWMESFPAGEPDRLHPLFVEHGVDYVFSGHYHSYTATEKDGVHYVMIGSSGGHIGNNPFRGEYYHYAWLTADAGGFRLAVLTAGQIRPETWLTLDNVVHQAAVEDCLVSMSRPVMRSDTGGKAAVRLDFAPGCGISGGEYEWNCKGTAWILSPMSGMFDLSDGSDTIHCAALLRGAGYPVPRLEVKTMLDDREYRLYRTLEPVPERTVPVSYQIPDMDGKAEESEWDRALVIDGFGDQDGGVCPTDPVRIRLMHDTQRIYVMVEADTVEPSGEPVGEVPARDEPVFMSDCVYLMIWSDEEPARITQIVVNDRGGMLDQQGFADPDPRNRPRLDPAWNAETVTGVSFGPAGWRVEMSVPLSDLGIRLPGTCRFNTLRYQPALDGLSSWVAPATFSEENAGIMNLMMPTP